MSDLRSFTHLHVHSHYSLLEALPKVDELVKAAKADGQTALALTDLGNMYAGIEFYKECSKHGIKPIIGADLFVAPRTRHDRENKVDDHTFRLVLLAKNDTGYRNLIKLVSRSFLEGLHLRPRIDRELLTELHEGLIAIMPSIEGEHIQPLVDGASERTHEIISWHKSLFADDLYLEITRHPEISGHEETMHKVRAIAAELGIACVATHDTYIMNPADAIARELVNNIRTGGHLNRDLEGSLPDTSFITQAQANELFANDPELLDMTQEIANKCSVTLDLGTWTFPNFPIPEGTTYDQVLHDRAMAGFDKRRVPQTPENLERAAYELGVISKKGYSPYFMVVSDLLTHAKEVGILTNTRGSAAGSLVSYLIGITTVNPLEYQLPFERFLNPERPSPPDIDMDVADNKRDAMIDYARFKYGDDHVAQIGTFGTMLARAAVRDVARALGHSYGVGDRIAKMIPFPKQGFPVFIKPSIETIPELNEVYKKDADAREILDLAQKVEGNARHVGVHAAGVVIAPSPVTDFVPIQLDPKGGKTITQYDMHAVEDAGLLKYDFLGLTNLSTLADAIDRVQTRLGITVDLDTLPLDDTKTYEMLARGETLGVFQLAGGGMTNYLVKLRPSVIHDINAMVALYRPGPMAFIPQYIERKNNPRMVKYLDPRMEPILKNSYGIITYQDDVLYIAIQLAGYTWLEADKFRKAMGKKIPEEMAKQKDHFTTGCLERGMKPAIVTELWEQIETFAAYGFNKAHAASYGNLAYKTAYMKANFPVDYMAALLTADAGEVEKISETVEECKRMKITVLPPSVNESFGTFSVSTSTSTSQSEAQPQIVSGISQTTDTTVSRGGLRNGGDATSGFFQQEKSVPEGHSGVGGGAIRFGLYSIKNFGTGVADSIIAARTAGGRFTDLADFLSRVADKNLNRKQLEALIQCGAMDAFGERGALLASMEALLSFHREHTKAPSAQESLFGGLMSVSKPTITLEHVPSTSQDERLAWEKELLGLYVSGHPLDKHRAKFADERKTIRYTKAKLKGVDTVIAGFLESVKMIMTKKGDRMAFLTISDFSDSVEAVIFPKTYNEFKDIVVQGNCIALKGKLSDRNGEPSFVVDKVKKL